ncbi:MAG: hypothetical protein HZY76_03170 [Anaerolineae bacterium]|nr:MAG: hypothetical protein HZY76_03170 [Anaerolineae bacterium]
MTQPMADHELVVIAEVPGRMVAEVLLAKLESAGIPAMLTFESQVPRCSPRRTWPWAWCRFVSPRNSRRMPRPRGRRHGRR